MRKMLQKMIMSIVFSAMRNAFVQFLKKAGITLLMILLSGQTRNFLRKIRQMAE